MMLKLQLHQEEIDCGGLQKNVSIMGKEFRILFLSAILLGNNWDKRVEHYGKHPEFPISDTLIV